MTPRTALATAVIAVAALSGLGACSDSASTDSIADQLDAQVAQSLDVGRGDVATSCPEDVQPTDGTTFDCDVTIEVQKISATVTFTSDERFTYELNGEVFDTAELVAALKRDAGGAMGAEVTELDCPGDTQTVIRAGETITCTGTNALGNSGKAVVGLDAEGKAVIQKLTN